MAYILLQFETIATIANAIAPTKNVVIAMLTTQSDPSAIEKATAQNNWVLAGYILALLLAAGMTYLSWRAGNRVQDLVRGDADARIAEANGKAATANERAGELEAANLTLRGQVATLETQAADAQKDVAGLQKAASDAMAVQQKVEIELAKQKERTAIAEREAFELKHRIDDELVFTLRPRSLQDLQMRELSDRSLNEFAETVVEVGAIDEILSVRLARDIADLLKRAGWRVTWIEPLKETADLRIGDGVRIHITDPMARHTPQGRAATALTQGLGGSHIVTRIDHPWPNQPVGTIRVIVGLQDTLNLRWWSPLNKPSAK